MQADMLSFLNMSVFLSFSSFSSAVNRLELTDEKVLGSVQKHLFIGFAVKESIGQIIFL